MKLDESTPSDDKPSERKPRPKIRIKSLEEMQRPKTASPPGMRLNESNTSNDKPDDQKPRPRLRVKTLEELRRSKTASPPGRNTAAAGEPIAGPSSASSGKDKNESPLDSNATCYELIRSALKARGLLTGIGITDWIVERNPHLKRHRCALKSKICYLLSASDTEFKKVRRLKGDNYVWSLNSPRSGTSDDPTSTSTAAVVTASAVRAAVSVALAAVVIAPPQSRTVPLLAVTVASSTAIESASLVLTPVPLTKVTTVTAAPSLAITAPPPSAVTAAPLLALITAPAPLITQQDTEDEQNQNMSLVKRTLRNRAGLTLSGILNWVAQYYPHYRVDITTLKNGVCYVLSTPHTLFKKLKRLSRSHLWNLFRWLRREGPPKILGAERSPPAVDQEVTELKNDHQRPPNYVEMVKHALEDKGNSTVSEILGWIIDRYPEHQENMDTLKREVCDALYDSRSQFQKLKRLKGSRKDIWSLTRRRGTRSRSTSIILDFDTVKTPPATSESSALDQVKPLEHEGESIEKSNLSKCVKLIKQALKDRGELTVTGIVDWILENYPYYKTRKSGLTNEVYRALCESGTNVKKAKRLSSCGSILWVLNKSGRATQSPRSRGEKSECQKDAREEEYMKLVEKALEAQGDSTVDEIVAWIINSNPCYKENMTKLKNRVRRVLSNSDAAFRKVKRSKGSRSDKWSIVSSGHVSRKSSYCAERAGKSVTKSSTTGPKTTKEPQEESIEQTCVKFVKRALGAKEKMTVPEIMDWIIDQNPRFAKDMLTMESRIYYVLNTMHTVFKKGDRVKGEANHTWSLISSSRKTEGKPIEWQFSKPLPVSAAGAGKTAVETPEMKRKEIFVNMVKEALLKAGNMNVPDILSWLIRQRPNLRSDERALTSGVCHALYHTPTVFKKLHRLKKNEYHLWSLIHGSSPESSTTKISSKPLSIEYPLVSTGQYLVEQKYVQFITEALTQKIELTGSEISEWIVDTYPHYRGEICKLKSIISRTLYASQTLFNKTQKLDGRAVWKNAQSSVISFPSKVPSKLNPSEPMPPSVTYIREVEGDPNREYKHSRNPKEYVQLATKALIDSGDKSLAEITDWIMEHHNQFKADVCTVKSRVCHALCSSPDIFKKVKTVSGRGNNIWTLFNWDYTQPCSSRSMYWVVPT